MDKDFDVFVDELQKQIFDEAKDVYGENGFHRWLNPRYKGAMDNCDAYARIKGSCGDTMEIFLKFDNNVVTYATYLTDGCASSNVCGSFAAELAIGKNPDELSEITGETILAKLGNLVREEEHCAFLAAETLQEALHNYMLNHSQRDK